jgi:hypothetical protein
MFPHLREVSHGSHRIRSQSVERSVRRRGDRRMPVSLALYREMVPGLQPGMEAVVLILIQELIDQTLAGAVAIDEAGCEPRALKYHCTSVRASHLEFLCSRQVFDGLIS